MSSSIVYKIVQDEDGEIVPCNSCGWKGETHAFGVGNRRLVSEEKEPLCEICSTTHLSSPHSYPSLYTSSDSKLFSGLAWIGNKLISEIRALRENHDDDNK